MTDNERSFIFLNIITIMIFAIFIPNIANAEESDNIIKPNLSTFSHMQGYVADLLPQMKLVKTFQFGASNTDEYITIFKIIAGDVNIENLKLNIKSDADFQLTNVDSIFAKDNTKIIYRIHANDPTTITGDLVSYDFR